MYEFRMPSLGADMEAGTLVEWLVKPGDAVKRGQTVVVVETQKGAVEVEIWEGGVVERIVVQPGMKVPVGELLALLRSEGESAATPAVSVSPLPIAAPQPTTSAPRVVVGRQRVAPSARKRARELGVDVEAVQPATPGGVVSREDIERAAALEQAAPAPDATAAGGDWRVRMRQAIAAAMAKSKREIPHYYLAADLDVTPFLEWLKAENLGRPVDRRLLPVVPYIKAVALALRDVPELNGSWTDGMFRPVAAVHLGLAIAMRGGGLVAPALHDAQDKSLDELMAGVRDLVTRVRSGRLRSSELSDATITFTNLGEQFVDSVFGVIYPPQVAIVGLGRTQDCTVIENGAAVVRKRVTVTLAGDHRASDGHSGALFLAALQRLLLEPEKL